MVALPVGGALPGGGAEVGGKAPVGPSLSRVASSTTMGGALGGAPVAAVAVEVGGDVEGVGAVFVGKAGVVDQHIEVREVGFDCRGSGMRWSRMPAPAGYRSIAVRFGRLVSTPSGDGCSVSASRTRGGCTGGVWTAPPRSTGSCWSGRRRSGPPSAAR